MTTQHSPTPWHIGQSGIGPALYDKFGDGVLDQPIWGRENMAHIVTAVNAHDDLVEAAEAALARLERIDQTGLFDGSLCLDLLRAAVAKAQEPVTS